MPWAIRDDLRRSFLAWEEAKAKAVLLEIVLNTGGGVRWSSVWSKVLAQQVIRLAELNRIEKLLKKDRSPFVSRLGRSVKVDA